MSLMGSCLRGCMMAGTPLFTDDPASDVFYRNLRAATNEYTRKARADCEALWQIYEPFADPEFRTELRSNFDARYWEMYLTTFLIREGYEVSCPKPGPDVGIKFNGRRIWFEATCPTRGADDQADQVPAQQVVGIDSEPVFQDVPNERLVLRYLNSISAKHKEQYATWLEDGTVAPDEAFIIAINPRRLGFEYADTQPPRILQAAFTIGSPYVVIDAHTLTQVDAGYQFRDKIVKASGSVVATGVFHLDEYTGLSALLCSRVDAVNQPEEMGADFQLVPNPRAKISLPDGFRLKGTYFRIEHTKDSYTATPEVHS
jgi:hypothetical protein